jgi:hypothetical protein
MEILDVVLRIVNVLSQIAAIIQTLLLFSRRQEQRRGPGVLSSNSQITLSRKRLFWLTGTVVALVVSSLSIYFVSPYAFTKLPDNKLEAVLNQQFVNETVPLDGKYFDNCTFINVTLKYEGRKNFNLKNNRFEGPIRLAWSNRPQSAVAAEVIQLLQAGDMIAKGRVGFIGDDAMILKDGPK